ncbi:MAG: helix-turn-helix domain-containing protein [Actinobacteria bacterium]|nr:helix-turn-helix domain-containing protein [Actinomycetota bacterium]
MSRAVTPTPWERLPADLAAAMRHDLPATVEEVAREVAEATPAFAAARSSKLERDLRRAVEVALARVLALVGTSEPAVPADIRDVFTALGAAEAREDRGPEALLAAFRTAAGLTLRSAARALGQVRPVGTDELLDLSDAITTYVDALAAAATDGFGLQLREQAGEGDRARRRLAELLVRGSAPDEVVRTAAAEAGWRGLDVVVPVVLPPEQARDARFRYGADGVVLDRERDTVVLLRSGPRATRAALTTALAGRGALVGPALPWPQVPEGVRLAVLAGEAAAPPDGADPVFAEDHLALLALRGEQGALAVLTARRLAPLAALRETQRERLLATLHSWLRHWGSRADVSAELFVHAQTVSYRLRTLRDLLGDDLDDPTARFELHLVLTHHLTAHAHGAYRNRRTEAPEPVPSASIGGTAGPLT